MGNERLFIENYYNNIVVVNPNKVYNQLNEVEDRNVSQENLVIYANLQCSLQPRSRLIKGEDFQEVQTIAASKLNFLNPIEKIISVPFLFFHWVYSYVSYQVLSQEFLIIF